MSESKDLVEKYFDQNTSLEQKQEIKKQILLLHEEHDDRIAIELGEAVVIEGQIEELKLKISQLQDPSKGFVIYLKIAASVILFIVSSFFVFRYFQVEELTNDQIFLSHFIPYDGVATLRGETSFQDGYQAFRDENYRKALSEFLKIEDEKNGHLKLLIASSYLSLEDVESSIRWLGKITDEESVLIKQNRDWYRSLALLKMERTEEAGELLNQLVESNSPFKIMALNLLDEHIFR